MKTGDLEPPLEVQCLGPDNAGVDLTQADSVTIVLARVDVDGVTEVVIEEAVPPEAVTEDGWVTRPWASGETDTPGVLRGVVRAVWTGGRPQTFPSEGFFTWPIEAALVDTA